MPLYPTTTLYDTLGVVPAADHVAIATAYKDSVIGLLNEDFPYRTTMGQSVEAVTISKLTAAYVVLSSTHLRQKYDRKLNERGLICPLCSGKGKHFDDWQKGIPCVACLGTGKGWDFK